MAVRVTLLIKKLDTLTDDEFHAYWAGTHADIFLKLPIVKEKVLKFSQFHVDIPISKQLSLLGRPIAEFDGGVDLWFASLEDVEAMVNDPEYLATVVPDGAVFSKVTESKMMIGYEKPFIADGKPL